MIMWPAATFCRNLPITLLEDCGSDHSDVLYHSAVRWLSLGKVLRRVWGLKTEILLFLEMKGKDIEYPQLRESEWLSDLAFAVDLFEHMNELNTRLQFKGRALLLMKCTQQ